MEVKQVREPLAIVGMACRFPGGAQNIHQFWENLVSGVDGITTVPADRWDARRFISPAGGVGKTNVRHGGFLKHNIYEFDPGFFGISPKDAAPMDIQQRMLLETCWEAFEDAGWPHERLRGDDVGVFVGNFFLDNKVAQFSPLGRSLLSASTATAATATMLSNRLSYSFDLRGPSMSVDTACSASLVALHLGCHAIWNGDCEASVVGGVNIILRPETTIVMNKGGFLSKAGRCFTFSERASGYVRGEGAGVVVLKPLSQALRDQDRVYACVRATGVNQDGRTPQGIAYPNGDAQGRLLRKVLSRADVHASEIDYVEAHGTGTQAGDQTEMRALQDVLSSGGREAEVWVGAVKSQIGHLEGAAGIAAVIKTALTLHHRTIPPNLHSEPRNPAIPFEDMLLKVPVRPESLEGTRCKALVNGFGYGGTNACALLEAQDESPAEQKEEAEEARAFTTLIPISGKNAGALKDRARAYLEHVQRQPACDLANFAYTTQIRRSHFEHRMAIVASDRSNLVEQLQLAVTGSGAPGVREGRALGDGRVAFIFTGMGPQWPRMGMGLYREFPSYRASLERCDTAIQKVAGWSIIEELSKPEAESRMGETAVAQVANFVLQAALVEVYREFGIRPAASLGHSVGEVTAAYCAGALDLEQAALLSVTRGRLQQTVAGGSMLAIACTKAGFSARFPQLQGVDVAAVNGPQAVTLSGDESQLKGVEEALTADGVFARFLQVEVAYHSAQMAPIQAPLLQQLESLAPQRHRHDLYSSVLGEKLDGTHWGADYWWRNVRETVNFHGALQSMVDDGYATFLEIGPHPVLSTSIKQTIPDSATTHSSLSRKLDDGKAILDSLASLYVSGVQLEWRRLRAGDGRLVDLPTYPWQRSHHWSESEFSRQDRLGNDGSPFFHQEVYAPGTGWQVDLNGQFFEYVTDHRLQADTVVFPGAAYVAGALEVNRKLHGRQECVLENVEFIKPLVVVEEQLQTLHTQYDAGTGAFAFYSSVVSAGEPTDWVLHSKGGIVEGPLFISTSDHLERLVAEEHGTEIPRDEFYEYLRQQGLNYGARFQTVSHIRVQENGVSAKLESAITTEELLDPTLLDGAFQVVFAWIKTSGERGSYLPVRMERVSFYAPVRRACRCHVQNISMDKGVVRCQLTLVGDAGETLAVIRGATFRKVNLAAADIRSRQSLYYELNWVEAETPTRAAPIDTFLIHTRESQFAEALREACEACGRNLRIVGDVSELKRLVGRGSAALDVVDCSLLDAEVDVAPADLARRASALAASLCQLRDFTEHRVNYRLIAPSRSPLTGALGKMLRVAENEIGGRVRTSIHAVDPQSASSAIATILGEEVAGECLHQRGGTWQRRLNAVQSTPPPMRLRSTDAVDAGLSMTEGQGLSRLHFETGSRASLAPCQVEIQVRAAGINFKDLLKVHNKLDLRMIHGSFFADTLGMEASGVVTAVGDDVKRLSVGQEVTAIAPAALATTIAVDEQYVVPKARCLDWPQAANMIVYMTAYRALIELANLQKGESILITSASGGVGLAAIGLAARLGATVFVTAGSEERREFLREMNVQHVLDSRSMNFVDEILDATSGRGVDVVLNASPGVVLRQSFNLMAPYGRFIDIGKKDIADNTGLPMAQFHQNVTFTSLDLDFLFKQRPSVTLRLMEDVVRGFDEEFLRPMPVTTIGAADIAEAFSLIERNVHLGKVVVDFRDQKIQVRDTSWLDPDATYLVLGGTKGFGFATAGFLAEHGAKRVVVASRSGRVSADDRHRFLSDYQTELVEAKLDVCDATDVRALVESCVGNGLPLKGVIHAATAYNDQFLDDLTEQSISDAIAPKVQGVLNLINALAGVKLRFLIAYSSISAIIGNRGQSSYVAANGFLESLSDVARSADVPLSVISWGAIAETGFVERQGLGSYFQSQGVDLLTLRECSDALRYAIEHECKHLVVSRFNWERFFAVNPTAKDSPIFAEMCQADDAPDNSLQQELAEVAENERRARVAEHLQHLVGQLVRAPAQDVDIHTGINDLGVDSLLASELNGNIQLNFNLNVPTVELLSGPTIDELSGALLARMFTER